MRHIGHWQDGGFDKGSWLMSGATEMQGMIVVSYSLIIILSLLSSSPRTSPFHLLFLGWEEGKRRKQEGLCLTTPPLPNKKPKELYHSTWRGKQMILQSEIYPCPLMRTFTYHDYFAVLLNTLTLPALTGKVCFLNLM
ncbi:hypothetical protein B0T13DRAFT_262816 [Neurospora crassa]|nr:hypothetical protein B0T13DRAFT_262816 [Neurospora crassa]